MKIYRDRRPRRSRLSNQWEDYYQSWPSNLYFGIKAVCDPNWAKVTWQESGLAHTNGWEFPKTLHLEPTATGVEITFQMASGQSTALWAANLQRLSHYLVIPQIHILQAGQGLIKLGFRVHDPLLNTVPIPQSYIVPDLKAVPIGVNEDGSECRIPILGKNILVAGVPGSGKSGLLWAVVSALAPAIKMGIVKIHVIDLKGGIEFISGVHLFETFATSVTEAIELMDNFELIMEDRLGYMRDNRIRKHTPSVDEPMHLLIIDEAAAMTAYVNNSKDRALINNGMAIILSKGRALGISTLLAVQDASKEVLTWRQLIHVRIALRMAEHTQIPMVLGRGANIDPISDLTPGIGYVVQENIEGISRMRVYEVDDDRIELL